MIGNPMLNQLKPLQNSSSNGLYDMIAMVKNSKNPQALINNMMAQNPQINGILNQYNGDSKAAFYGLAQQRGINPNAILKMLK